MGVRGKGWGWGVPFHLIACCLLSILPCVQKQPYMYPRVQCTLFFADNFFRFCPTKKPGLQALTHSLLYMCKLYDRGK